MDQVGLVSHEDRAGGGFKVEDADGVERGERSEKGINWLNDWKIGFWLALHVKTVSGRAND